MVGKHLASESEHQPESVLGDRNVVGAYRDDDWDPVLGGGRRVDGVVTDARARNDAQVG